MMMTKFSVIVVALFKHINELSADLQPLELYTADGYACTPKRMYKDSGQIKGSPFPFPCVRE